MYLPVFFCQFPPVHAGQLARVIRRITQVLKVPAWNFQINAPLKALICMHLSELMLSAC